MAVTTEPFAAVFNQHYPQVFRLAHSLCGNRSDAEDITQEVFLGVLKGLPAFRGDAQLGTWIYRITTRVAGRYLARQSRHQSADVTPLTDNMSIDDDIALREFIREINQLSVPQRTILSLVAIEGLSHQVAADVLGIPVGTVWSRLHKARKQLTKNLTGGCS